MIVNQEDIAAMFQKNQDFATSYKQYANVIAGDDNQAIYRTQAYNYSNDTSSITLRNNPYQQDDYGRSAESYGYYDNYKMECIIDRCMQAYDEEPIVSNIMDLMSEFSTQGVRIVCADKKQERFGNEWFEYLGGGERCERFVSILLRGGTTVVKWVDGKVPLKRQKKWKAVAELGENGPVEEVVHIEERDAGRAIMPLKWVFYDPRQVVMVGGMLANFVGKPIFALRINQQLRNEINQVYRLSEKEKDYKNFQEMIPDYVIKAINDNSLYFPLDQSKVAAYYYKKDDWSLWGKPLVRPILKDIKMLNKIKACDSAALDGAMSSVRLWKMGDLKTGIVPQKPALAKFRDILANVPMGGTTDIVWGPDIELVESKSNLYEYLKPEKYLNTLSQIYAGLGVPPGLTGASGSSSFTNNNVSLKTLIERLKYVRTILVKFLTQQLELVQKAMGFTKKFEVMFDQMVLSDEAAEKTLFLQLWDRDIISDEAVRYVFDLDHQEIEEAKINRGNRRRGKSLPDKASPFHSPQKEHELKKILAQKGAPTPSQLGLNFPDKKEGEKTIFESTTPKEKVNKPKGTPLSGRPKNAKDKTKRKAKRVLPKGSSAHKDLFRYAEQAQRDIEELVNPAFLAVANKKNVRSLTNDETQTLENLKMRIFSNLEPYSDISLSTIQQMHENSSSLDEVFYTLCKENEYILMSKYGRDLTIAEKRNIMCETFAELYCENS